MNHEKLLKRLYDKPHEFGQILGYKNLGPTHSDWIKEAYFSDKDITLLAHRGSYKTTAIIIVGSIWFYMFQAHYPFDAIIDPAIYPQYQEAATSLIAYLPPLLLGIPNIYFAVFFAFIFVIVVYI